MQLIEIPFEKWPQLRDLYQHKKDLSSSYNTLQMCINWIEKDPQLQVKIYTTSKEWHVDGTFVTEAPITGLLFCNTLKEDFTDLVNTLNHFDNSKMVGGHPERLMLAVEKHFLDSGLNKEQFRSDGGVWQYISREEALNFNTDLPENITTKGLDVTHAEQINRVWPHRFEGSLTFVEHLIKFNKSVGLFEGEQLVAWCLIYPLGSLGLLQVEESHRRKGLGKLVVKIMSKYLAEQGIEVTASVVTTNSTSRSMFKQLGFKIIDTVYWTFKI
uniref:N-acetyltransferase domain-containing protein n=1 Tax=Stomoxys calcitrans TaxID=35570 RepID=A0A1I8NS10_STOCA